MNITITIPDDLVEPLHAALGNDLSRAAVEQFALEGYRSRKLSRYQVQKLLGFESRWDAERWLGGHRANVDYDVGALESDRATLDQVLGPANS